MDNVTLNHVLGGRVCVFALLPNRFLSGQLLGLDVASVYILTEIVVIFMGEGITIRNMVYPGSNYSSSPAVAPLKMWEGAFTEDCDHSSRVRPDLEWLKCA